MYDRTNEIFLDRPNLFLGLMMVLGFGPWLFLASALAMKAASAGFVLLCLMLPFAIFAMNAWLPMTAKEEDFQRRIERNYRLIRIIAGILMCGVAPLVLRQWPALGVQSSVIMIIGCLTGLWGAGHHIRYRWLRPDREVLAK